MKFAICNETFRDMELASALKFAHELGYTGIEFAPFTLNPDARLITAEQRSEARHLAEQHGLEVVGLHWLLAFTEGYYLTSPDAKIRESTAAYLADLAKLCFDLGGKYLVLGSPAQRNLMPGVSHDQAMEFAADVLKQCEPALAKYDLILAVEPLGHEEGDFLNTAELGRQLVDQVDSPHCRLHLDVKAMSAEEKPIDQIIHESKDYVVHFHANDANRRGPGMGTIDFVPILRALQEINYQGWVSVEVFDYSPGIEALARQSIENLRRCLAEAD